MISTRPRLTGERPREGATPCSLLSLHDAGYREMTTRLGPGLVLDVGTGEGFESVRLGGAGRRVIGVDYSERAVVVAKQTHGDGMAVGCMDARSLGLADDVVDWVCSSHLIEHFCDPAPHVAEMARVLHPEGTVFVLTPNAPADFENPFHLRLFGPGDLSTFLGRWFAHVTVLGLDASPRVKEDFASRRARATRLLRLDVFDLRHRMPRRWYVGLYTRLLPIAYRVLERRGPRGVTVSEESRIGVDDWFVTERIDDTTPVLFAICRGPRGSA